MSRFRFTPLAESDLEEIVRYIADEASPERARSVLDDILGAADQLAGMPGLGHSREDLTDERVLLWPVHSYLLVYRPETRPLEIVRVVSGWRDVPQLLR